MATRKKKRTRRRKPIDRCKTNVIRFRLTDKDKDLIEAAAELDDLGMSAWIRQVVVKRAREIVG